MNRHEKARMMAFTAAVSLQTGVMFGLPSLISFGFILLWSQPLGA